MAARTKRFILAGFFLLVFASFGFAQAANAAPGDIGSEGPSTSGAGSGPTGEKPESKVWWNDGIWWASMWDSTSADFHIFKLDPGTQSWVDTRVALDDRSGTRADTLWDDGSGKLYVASHVFTSSSGSGSPSRLYRFSYDPATDTYSRDAGFPVSINNFKTETLVIARDSTGQIWATWRQGTNILVNRTVCNPTCDDKMWGTPLVLASVSSDDVSSVVAFGGNKVGVMWSDQNGDRDSFAVHADSAADNVWTIETALQGPGMADDHINLKADSTGRVFAAVKTSRGGSTDPLTMLLTRSAAGVWSSAVFGLKRDHHTRPIVELDEANGVLHMFATAPESGGVIYEKTAPVDAVSFAPGLGTPVLKDADGSLNNVTSAKQNVSGATGLVVVASGNAGRYWSNSIPLGGSGGPVKPTASFTGAPTSGTAPLAVQFTDASTGAPDTWAWDFQNDGTIDSTQQSPQFTYATPGVYSVKLTVTNTAGSSSLMRAGYITVGSGGGGAGTLTLVPTDDAYVRDAFPDENTGSQTTLRTYRGDHTMSYLKFSVAGIAGPVTSVKLRLYVTDPSDVGGAIYAVGDTAWTEGSITWTTRPGTSGLLGTGGTAATGTWVEFDLGSAITTDGTYSFALKDGGSDAVRFSSKEGAQKPQLIVTFGS